MPADTLRDRQAALARTAIFETLVRHLEAGDADDLSMEALAREAGVSRRTLYRYFPTRGELLAAAGEWIRDEALQLPVGIGTEGIAGSFRAAAARLSEHPKLARALLRTQTGSAMRTSSREAREKAIRAAVLREVPGLPHREVARAAAVLAYLCSSRAWITIQDESGLDAKDAQGAVVWAIETLLARLREQQAQGHTVKTGGAR